MNICPICKKENDKFTTVCSSCGSFLQNRVVNLDLFGTVWKIIENPKEAIKLILLAEHKNYVYLLFAICGINLVFTSIWILRLGVYFGNLLYIILFGIIIGIPFGIILGLTVSILHMIISRLFGGKTSFKISAGILSYSSTPIIISLFFILPVKLAIFGIYLFTSNPSPAVIKPVIYMILLGFDIILASWNYALLIFGTSLGNQISAWRSIITVTILYIILITGLKYLENIKLFL